jgi:hypothetical protein
VLDGADAVAANDPDANDAASANSTAVALSWFSM